ncbi:MAG: UDP-N-acetylmuramate--L-alanine ligase [Bacteroidales bacterium]|nr:UDP-N-acetylmuramate--L-alanine ligase [Bacteroidales bacterium]MDT8432510.1 UDP-N-acetylmuramate--L-alanine ligase [Bacteroidales bacterium]
MIWANLDSVYFVGIGGIGMSALARFFRHRGKNVAGYDRTSTELTDQLAREGIDIHFLDQHAMIPRAFRDPERTLVIYTPAVSEQNSELNYFHDHGFRVIKRSTALGEVFNAGHGIGVAGTHGKTSVSTMLAHVMSDASIGCNAFLGGISKNFNSNIVIHPISDTIIAEADEYDRSFLTLFPKIAVVTSVDDDHMDIYGTRRNLLEGFEKFLDQVSEKGKLVIKHGLELQIPGHLEVFTYALDNPDADYYVSSRKSVMGKYHFTVRTPMDIFETSLGVPGLVNVENALAAIAVADQSGVPLEKISSALEGFRGVKRRFDVQVWNEDRVYIDDYAHHPEELKAFIGSVREIFPGKKITGIFQPHLFTRTRDLAEAFGASLSMLDELILLDIYPAREAPIQGITSGIIFREVQLAEKVLIKYEQLMNVLKERNPEVLLTMGAGDIDRLVEPLKSWMERK